MTKCDFCDNEAIGYTIQQYFLYCEKYGLYELIKSNNFKKIIYA